ATFEVASVKANPRPVGPDYNNQLIISSSKFIGRNATLRRLIAEAYRVQVNQVVGPGWLNESEYDIEARAGNDVSPEQLRSMLQTLLADRFHLRKHTEHRTMRAYELVIDKGGPKVAPVKEGVAAPPARGFRFHGEMRQLADVIAVQLTI